MPDTNEVAAAMERLRKHREVHGTERYAESPYYVPEHAPQWQWDYQKELADIRTVADARLAEHDPGPITDEVLRECVARACERLAELQALADANAADAARWRELTRRDAERREREAAENAELRDALRELHHA